MPVFVPHTASRRVDETGNSITVGTTLTPILVIKNRAGVDCEVINTEQLEDYVVTIHNTGGTALNNITLEHSATADFTASEDRSQNVLEPIDAGQSKSLENITNVRKYLRVRGQVAAGSTTVTAYLRARTARN